MGILVLLGAIGSAVLWIGIVAPAIARVLGVPMTFGLWRVDRRNQHLSPGQYVWALGWLTCGLGMFLYFIVYDYLCWRLLGDRFSQLTLRRVTYSLVVTVLWGLLFGVIAVFKRDPEK